MIAYLKIPCKFISRQDIYRTIVATSGSIAEASFIISQISERRGLPNCKEERNRAPGGKGTGKKGLATYIPAWSDDREIEKVLSDRPERNLKVSDFGL